MDLRSRIDATLLKHDADLEEVLEFARRSSLEGFRAVVVYPFHAEYLVARSPDIPICTVIGFPHGSQLREAKGAEAELANEIGVSEIDYVVSIPAIKNGIPKYLAEEARLITSRFPGVVKAIVEVPILTDEELRMTLEVLEDTDVDYVKTSTGLYRAVTPEDVTKIRKISSKKIKAAGGIRSKEQALELIRAGADVLGTSKPFDLVAGLPRD